MKSIFLFLILFPVVCFSQTRRAALLRAAAQSEAPAYDYLVSNTDGSADFSTIAAVNAYGSFSPGDVIALKRGDSWNEVLVPPISGTSGNHLVFTATGTGDLPSLWGVTLDFKDYITVEYLDLDSEMEKVTTVGMYDANYNIVRYCTGGNPDEKNIVYIGPGTGNLVSHCTFANTTYDATLGKNTHVVYISGYCYDNIIEYCDLSGGQTSGIQINPNGDPSHRPIIRYNWVHDNSEIGVNNYGSDSMLMHNNFIYDNDGIEFYNDDIGSGDMTNSMIYNNVFYNLAPAWGEGFALYACDVVELKNNIFYFPNNNIDLSTAGATNLDFDYNMYQCDSYDYGTWSNWVSSLGHDPNGSEDDPEMVAPASQNFNLGTGSPAIDAGVDVGLDYLGTAPDIGAIEKE